MQPRFSSLAFLIYSIGDLCLFICNLPYRKFFQFSWATISRGYLVLHIFNVIFSYLRSFNYRAFFFKSYYSMLTSVYIVLGNYNQVGHLLNRYDAFEEEERQLVQEDFISLFKHLNPAKKKNQSNIIANMVIQEIIDEVVNSACSEAGNKASSGWEKEIESLEKEGIMKNLVEKENESGFFEEEILDGY